MGLIKLVATFLIIYLVFRFFTMYLFPAVLRWYMYRFKKKFYEQNPHLRNEQQRSGSKSKVNVSDDPSKTAGRSTNQIGEYVDFEEIKDKDDKKPEA